LQTGLREAKSKGQLILGSFRPAFFTFNFSAGHTVTDLTLEDGIINIIDGNAALILVAMLQIRDQENHNSKTVRNLKKRLQRESKTARHVRENCLKIRTRHESCPSVVQNR